MSVDRRQVATWLGSSIVVAAVVSPVPSLAQRVVFPKRGTGLRKALLDTVRPTFERDTRGPVEFVVHRLAISGRFAFGHVSAQRPGGGRINWMKTVYAKELKEGFFDPVGPTDVPWDGWRQQFRLPVKLFRD